MEEIDNKIIENNGINVLSLFDGISCGQIALERAGIKVNNYYASEIDKHAIKVTQHNYPNTIQLGDVTKISVSNLPKIDIIIGGSPCQGFSMEGKQLNFNDTRSKLFFEYERLLKELNPSFFLLENVGMQKIFQDIISSKLFVEPIKIDSKLVSAQTRNRLYWTNIKNIVQPQDKKIFFKHIKDENDSNYRYWSKQQMNKWFNHEYVRKDYYRIIEDESKVGCLMAQMGTNKPKTWYKRNEIFRLLTPLEWERLQTVPDNYTNLCSANQRYKMLGNGWTVDVIAHIFSHLPYAK